MITLAVDASTYVGTVALARDGALLAHGAARMRGEQEERLMPAVADLLARSGIGAAQVERIVCGAGPGSFTSLRIAASIAKGLATGWGRPLYAVSSLALIVAGADPALAPGRYVATLDALRDEAYAGAYEIAADGAIAELGAARRVPNEGLAALAASLGAILVGPGQELTAAPDARGIVRLEAAIAASGPVELGGWEPAYGRLAEAQVKWEAAHGRPLSSA